MNLVPNPSNRYAVGDRTAGLQRDTDGALTISIQAESPGEGQEANWLPCPAEGTWFVVLRLYRPRRRGGRRQMGMPADPASRMTSKLGPERRIAIACQGGGSQCAFVAGALGTLLVEWGTAPIADCRSQRNLGGRHYRRARLGRPPRRGARGRDAHRGPHHRLLEGFARQTPQDIFFDRFCLAALRLTEVGWLPSFASSPASAQFQFWSRAVSRLMGRPEFTDLGALLAKHVPFAELADAGRPREPGASGGGGGRARGHLQGLQLQTRRDNARIGARIGGDPDAVSGRVGQRPRLLGRHLLVESADPRLLAQTADGRRDVSERDLDHPGQPRTPRHGAGAPERHLRSPQPSERQPEPPARASGRRHLQCAVQLGAA